ncbi:MAG: hypothetical protein M3Q45_04035, partial [Chloroflexota bacterium]|nr:hypothetical protein [Chloroflexota bacterium]
MDKSNLIERLISLFADHHIRYCVIGGQAVNAYVDPLISLDLDIVVAVEQIEQTEQLFQESGLTVRHFPHSLNIGLAGSDVRIQIQTDPRYYDFVDRAAIQE